MAAPRNRPIVEELEARVLYSADLAPGFAAGALPAETRLLDDSADRLAPSAQSEAQVRLELVVVDARVDDADTLLTGLDTALGRRFEVIRLAAGEDGIARVGEALREREALAAVHFIAHGEAGRLQLGATWLDDQSLAARAGEIAAWGDALGADADILLYGCDVGETADGQAFLTRLGELTGADVAASRDATGSAALGGDWDLEWTAGAIETPIVFRETAQGAWSGVLAAVSATTTTDVLDGTTTSITALQANPGTDGLISLREAIIAANNTAGADTISLGVGTYTLTRAGINENAANTGDLDITDALTITGAGATSTIVDGNALDRVFHVLPGVNAILTDLTIRGGVTAANQLGGGVYVDSGANLALSRAIVTANSAGSGGGLYNFGTLTATDTTFSNNAALDWGGGLYNDRRVMALERVTISGNTAGRDGAGIYNTGAGAALSLINATVSGNIATEDGGGIYTNRSMTITSSTIALNTSVAGADGIHVLGGGGATLKNTILYNPAGTNSNAVLNSVGNNLDSDGTAGLTSTGDQSGTVVAPIDPMLGPLQNNGGATRTHALLAGSPAINAGTATGAPATDQRGLSRVGATDIGAYEFGGTNAAPVLAAIGNQSANEGVTLSFTASASDAELPAQTLSYSLDAASLALGMTIDSGTGAFSWTPSEGQGGTAPVVTLTVTDSGGLTDSETITITVIEVNDAPTATNLGAAETYTEDTALNLTNIVISDVDSADVTATLTLSNPAAGSLNTGTSGTVTSTYNAGTGVWSATGALADVNSLLAGLTFTPSLNFNGNFSIATSVDDGVAAPLTGSKAMTGTAVNDAPTATNLNAPETYTEDTALNLTNIVISDVDSADVTATLTLSNPAAGSLNTGTSGTVTSTYNAGTGVWSATGALADVNSLLAGLTFTPSLNFNGNFSIATSVDDGVAAPLTGSKAMTGTAVNDAPTATNLGAAEIYTEDTALNLTNIVISDVDSVNVTATLTLSNAAAGSLNTGTSGLVTSTYNAGTGVWSATGALADVNSLLAGLSFTPSLNFNSNFSIATSVDDGVAAPLTGSKAMTGTAVNDAPTATNLNAPETYTEDTALNLTNIVISDVDSVNVTATLTLSNAAAGSLNTGTSGLVTSTYNAGTGVWSATGALADVNSLLAGLTFTPSLNFNGNFSIATSVDDGVAAPLTGSKAMTGTAVNDAPTATNLNAPETYTEDTALNLTNIVISDVDSASVTAFLILSNSSAGSLNTGTSGTVTSTYNAGTGVWSASGALADVNSLLAGLTFTPALNFNGSFSIITSVSDGTALPIIGIKAMTGNAVNDAPTATNLNAAETYTEDTALNLTNIVISDVDSADVTATLTLSNPAAGSLNTGTSGTVTSTYNAGTGVWSATGALADVNSLLAGLTFTPSLNFNGNFSIATSVDDGVAAPLTGSKAMTGTAVNDAPILAAIGNQTIAEGITLAFTASATDADLPAQSLSYSLTGAPAGATINASTGAFSWTPTEAQGPGSYSFDVLVSDGALTDSETITVTVTEVNDAPILAAIGNQTIAEGSPLSFTATATDADLPAQSLSFSLTGAPAGATINASTGAFSWTPTEAQGPGSYSFDVLVSDGALTDSETITVTVTEVNDAPILAAIGNQTIAEGSPLSFTATATDADLPAQSLSYSLTGAPAGATINATSGAFSWTPTEAQGPGSYSFDILVSDGALTDSETITVTVTEVNDAPILGAIGNQTIAEGSPLSFTASATDADLPAQSLSYSLAGAPAGATINASTGAFSWTPTEAQGPGSYSFDILVSDGTATDFETITVTVTEVNDAPILGPIGNQTIAEGSTLAFTASATDADLPAQSLSYSLAGAPAGASIDAGTGVFSWTPTEAQGPGSYSFDVLVSDGALSDSETITVTVTEVNDAPILAALGNQTVNEGSLLSFTASATDADLPAQSLSYSLTGAPAGATINATTGAFRWTPTEAQGGTASVVTLTVTDSGGLTDSETFSITVGDNNLAPILAAIGNRVVTEGDTLGFTASASDADLPVQTLSYSLDAASLALGMTIDSSTGAFIWTPTDAQGGTAPVVTLTVTDSGGLIDSESVRIIVIDSSSQPDAGAPVPDPDPDPDPAPAPAPAPDPAPVKPPSITKPGNILVPPDVTRPAALEDSLGSSRLILPDSVREGISTASGMSRAGFQFVSNTPGPLVATSWVSQGFSLNLLESLQVQVMESVRQGIGSTGFTDALDRMRNEIQARKEFENIVIGSSVAMSGGLSIGYVLWLLRGGALLGSLLSALPAWAALDPMPVLAYYLGRGRDDDDDDDFSERMFEKARKPKPAVASPAVPADVTPDDSTEPT
jgi:hypothetical protein